MAHQRVFPAAGFSGRAEGLKTVDLPARLSFASRPRRKAIQKLLRRPEAQADASKGFGETLKNIAKQVQGALPIVGLISRLASTSGGVGRDELAYPEFARQLLNRADPEFDAATKTWESRFDRAGQRRYVVLFLWMAYTGLGIVPRKAIVNAGARLRVTHDITAEVERFELERESALSVYKYGNRPAGKLADQISVAIDALARLSIGLKDGDPIPEEERSLLLPIVTSTFAEFDGAEQLAVDAMADAARSARKTVNK